MSISNKEKEMIEKMRDVQLFENGEEDINIFESSLNEIKSTRNIDIIPYLCSVMSDDAMMASPVEGALKTILYIVQNNDNGMEKAISKVFEGTKKMLEDGHDWALMLHMQFIIDSSMLDTYLECFRQLGKGDREMMLELLNELNDEEFFTEPDLGLIIEKLEIQA